MEIFAYVIPFVAAIIAISLFGRKVTPSECASIVIVPIVVCAVIHGIALCVPSYSTEYLGGYMSKISHYDAWNEWVQRTCTREVPDGTDKDGNTKYRTETYDCSYVDEHPERWTYTDEKGEESLFMSSDDFIRAYNELGRPKMVFVDMNRHYYTKDGDRQDYFYDNTIAHIRPIVTEHEYANPIKDSKSIYNFSDISDEDVKNNSLFDYPNVIDDDQDVILGFKASKKVIKRFKYINSVYGTKKQFKLFILCFKDKDIEVAELQKSYWKGGNKNELVICIGYDSKTTKIKWCYPFSWSDDNLLEVKIKSYFRSNNSMYLYQFGDFLEKNIHLWKRKEFKDFNYLSSSISNGTAIALIIISIILSIVASAFAITNEIDNDENGIDTSKLKCNILNAIMNISTSLNRYVSTFEHINFKY